MEAIQNNYLLVIGSGQKNGAIEEEFRQMSEWRDMAKSIADRILEYGFLSFLLSLYVTTSQVSSRAFFC